MSKFTLKIVTNEPEKLEGFYLTNLCSLTKYNTLAFWALS
jgi:hypothetical protein